MNDSLDENLAQTLFERAAEKCTDKKSRIAFCKEQLKKYGFDIDNIEKSASQKALDESLISREFARPFGSNNLKVEPVHVYYVQKNVPNYNLQIATNPTALKESVKYDMVQELMKDMVKNGFIHFEEHKNFQMDSLSIHAAIKVAEWRK